MISEGRWHKPGEQEATYDSESYVGDMPNLPAPSWFLRSD